MCKLILLHQFYYLIILRDCFFSIFFFIFSFSFSKSTIWFAEEVLYNKLPCHFFQTYTLVKHLQKRSISLIAKGVSNFDNFIIFSFGSFSQQRRLMVFHWSLRYINSLQVTRTLLADLNKAVLLMIFSLPLISRSSGPCTNHFLTE